MGRRALIGLILFALIFGILGGAGVSSSGIEGGNGIILSTENSTNNTVIWIHNVYELQNMSKNLSGNYALANDINASITKTWNGGSGFAPIGTPASPFNGTFDGKGHKIINLSINRTWENEVGLFGYISSNAVIENVGLENVSVIGYVYVGGLVAYNDEGRVNNSYATGNVSGWVRIGALVGENYQGTVENSYATAEVRGAVYIGGLVGENYYGRVIKCDATGDVSGGEKVGGLVGHNWGMVSSCYAMGNVSGAWRVGGLVGWNDGTVNNSYAMGYVSIQSGAYAGGLVGWNKGTLSNCSATGDVSGSSSVGGLVGLNEGTVNSSYAAGNVSGYDYVGGLVGNNWQGTVNSSYATGDVNGSGDYIGGLVGCYWRGTVNSSYAAGDVSGHDYVGGLVGCYWRGTVNSSYATGDVNGSGDYVGGLVGRIEGTLSNSSATGNVTGGMYVGGLVGWNKGTVSNCSAAGDVNGSGDYVGGLVGNNLQGTVNSSYATGNVSGDMYVGGLVGCGWNAGAVSDSYATGNVSGSMHVGGLVGRIEGAVSDSYATGNVSGDRCVGGLVGRIEGTVSSSYATGDVIGGEEVGGLVGWNVGAVSDSYATGNVSGSMYVGGLVGRIEGAVSDSYATGNVSGDRCVGGLVGYSWEMVSSSYATGDVIGGEEVGGLVGWNVGTVSDSYATGNASGSMYVGGLVGYSWEMVSSSYATGDVIGGEEVGGLVGRNVGTVSNSSATGNVSGDMYVGGLVGWNEGTLSNSHYNIDKVVINSGHYPTLGGLFDSQYNDWLSHGLRLNISDYSSTLIPAGGYYLINSVQGLKDLLGFADMNYKFRLAADLDLSSEPNLYIPYFTGEFDGNNHTVSNLRIDMSFGAELGLFGHNIGTVKNVGMVNVSVNGRDYVGGLVGMNDGTINNSYSAGNVSGSGWYVGGLVGENHYGAVSNSYAIGDVSGGEEVGGLVGRNVGTVSNSHAIGDVSGGEEVGGLVGRNVGTVSNSHAIGDVSGGEEVGGLIGYNYYGTVSSCYATSNVDGDKYVGGFFGENYQGTVGNSYATGEVRGVVYVGGLVGYNYRGTVKCTYAAGKVIGSSHVGGLIGYNEIGKIIVSFWDINTTGQTTSAGGIGKTTDEMKNKTTFTSAGWNFVDTWAIIDGVTYPFLRWQVTAPSAPRNLTARWGDRYVNLTWEAPADDGGSLIVGYKVYRGTSSGNETYLTTVGNVTTYYNDTGLTNGRTYYYRVSAVNGLGEGELSEEVSATPLGVPSAPQNLVAIAGDGYVSLTWEAPDDNGGLPIVGYNIYRGTSSGNETLLATVGNVLTYNDTGLTNGQTYYYRVSAVNGVGEGELSVEVNATPKTIPSAPQNLVARAGNRYVVLTWEAPADDGGSPIIGYKIYRGTSSGNVVLLTTVENETTYNDTGLTNGQRYYYRVSAVNGLGEGELSVEVNATPKTVPSAPRSLVARGGDGYVVLTWEGPVNDGGSPIIGYKIYRGIRSGNESYLMTLEGNETTYNDTGVTNGWRYYYKVSALNGVGEGDLSLEVSALPRGVPPAPRNLVARAGDGYVNLTWEVPATNGGSPITGYKIYRGTSSGNETLLTTVGNVFTYNDTGVTNGQTYYYRVSAMNGLGEGELSEEVSAVPRSVPSASKGRGSFLFLASVMVVILIIVLIFLFARWRKGEPGEGESWGMSIEE